jgi:quinol monooxygenase YgiN
MPFVVAATWKAKAGEEDYVRSTIELLTPLSRAEPANLQYQAHIDPNNPGTFFLYEQYVDEAGYESHKQSPYFQEHVFGDVLARLEQRQVSTYQTLDF